MSRKLLKDFSKIWLMGNRKVNMIEHSVRLVNDWSFLESGNARYRKNVFVRRGSDQSYGSKQFAVIKSFMVWGEARLNILFVAAVRPLLLSELLKSLRIVIFLKVRLILRCPLVIYFFSLEFNKFARRSECILGKFVLRYSILFILANQIVVVTKKWILGFVCCLFYLRFEMTFILIHQLWRLEHLIFIDNFTRLLDNFTRLLNNATWLLSKSWWNVWRNSMLIRLMMIIIVWRILFGEKIWTACGPILKLWRLRSHGTLMIKFWQFSFLIFTNTYF